MKKLSILIPSVSRATHPSLLKCLRNNGEREVRIVGVDMEQGGIGPHIADVFYQVPPRNSPSYMETILDICRKEAIDVYYALGEEEAIAASLNKAAFDAIGTGVITPGTAEMLAIATNKCLWHDFFKNKGVPQARYRTVDSAKMIATTAYELGYPDQDVFFKPAISKGGRGARIITSRDLFNEYYFNPSIEPMMSLESFLNMLSPIQEDKFRQLVAMEYLPGTYYSVDVLSQNGQVIYAIPKIRIAGSASNTTVGQVDLNPETIELASMACGSFKFSYLQNYEMKLNSEGQPRIYDINPRGGASLGLCAAAGANIAYYAVKMAMGENIPRRKIKDKVKMIRFYDEYYEYND
ncbi:ATP-grasp domain-containing protein [Chloroflexota bacterium]